MICPICQQAFTPRTTNQTVCCLHCFVAMKHHKGQGNQPLAAGSAANKGGDLSAPEDQAKRVVNH